MLVNFPEDWLDRWRAIRRFVKNWHGVPLPDVGGQREKIGRIESTLGYGLPGSFHEWIAFIYDLIDANGFELVFRDSLSFAEIEGTGAVSLLIQGEGDYHWAIEKADLSQDDAPVEGYQLNWEDNAKGFVHDMRWSPRLTTWAIRFILGYLTITSEGFGTKVKDFPAVFSEFCQNFPAHVSLDGDEVFEARNLLAVLSREYGFGKTPYLNVSVWRPISKDDVPAFIWKLAKGGGWFGGMFAPPTR
jgi:hypothetical protein